MAICETGAVAAGELYTLTELKRRLNLKDYAIRRARQRGLKVRKIGRVAYVLGRDVIDHLKATDAPGVSDAK